MSDPNRAAEKAAAKAAKDLAVNSRLATLSNNGIEFQEWPKIGRLNRDIVITEKLDGTNAAIGIKLTGYTSDSIGNTIPNYIVYAQSRNRIITPHDDNYGFAAWVEKNSALLAEHLGEGLHFGEWWGVSIARNYGLSERRFSLFNTAKWNDTDAGVAALAALRILGVSIYSVPVLYTGPWTGLLGYKDAATGEWLDLSKQENWPEVLTQTPVDRVRFNAFIEGWVEQGSGDELNEEFKKLFPMNPRPRFAPNFIAEWLKREGSQAVPGFMNPEGVVVFHKATGTCFKVTLEGDEKHKGEK